MNKNANKSAFARAACIDPESGQVISDSAPGLTKRELFAALALQGLAGNSSNNYNALETAIRAVILADELLIVLEAGHNQRAQEVQ